MCNRCRNLFGGCCCLNIVLAVVAGLFVTLLGVILGAVFSEAILGAIAAVIVLGVALLIMFIVTLIYRACTCGRSFEDD